MSARLWQLLARGLRNFSELETTLTISYEETEPQKRQVKTGTHTPSSSSPDDCLQQNTLRSPKKRLLIEDNRVQIRKSCQKSEHIGSDHHYGAPHMFQALLQVFPWLGSFFHWAMRQLHHVVSQQQFLNPRGLQRQRLVSHVSDVGCGG